MTKKTNPETGDNAKHGSPFRSWGEPLNPRSHKAPARSARWRQARRCAKRGWAVFPLQWITDEGKCSCGNGDCQNAGKHPMTEHGFKDATKQFARIDRWWRASPHANVGIATGKVSNLFVVDIDPRNGGDASLKRLVEAHGPFPDTVCVKTGGGGDHLYVAHPGGNHAGWQKHVAAGIDICADGSYVVGAGSSHKSGKPYVYAKGHRPKDLPPALPPAWIVTLARKAEKPEEGDSIPEGFRNTKLFKIGCRLRGVDGFDEDTIRAALLALRTTHCEPGRDPFSEEDVGRIAHSCCRYEAREKRKAPQLSFAPPKPVGETWSRFTATLDQWAHQGLKSVPTDLPTLDKFLGGGLPRGKVTILSGSSGFGRSSFSLGIARRLARTGVPVLFASLELSFEAVRARIVSQVCDKPWLEVLAGKHPPSVAKTLKRIKKTPLYIVESDAVSRVEAIGDCARYIKERHGDCGLIVVDYLQWLPDLMAGDNARHAADAVSHEFTELAKELNCAILAISLLGRTNYSLGDHARGPIDFDRFLATPKESGRIEYDAGVVMVMVRCHDPKEKFDPRDQRGVIVLPKNRLNGQLGKVPISFDGRPGRFKEIDETELPAAVTGLSDAKLGQQILAAMAGGGLRTLDQVRSKVRRGKKRVSELVKVLETDGWIRKEKGEWKLDPSVTKDANGDFVLGPSPTTPGAAPETELPNFFDREDGDSEDSG